MSPDVLKHLSRSEMRKENKCVLSGLVFCFLLTPHPCLQTVWSSTPSRWMSMTSWANAPPATAATCASIQLETDIVELYAVSVPYPDRPYSCRLCPYSARDKYNIRLHLERKHELSSYNYTCDICFKQVKTKQDLSQHRRQCRST